MNVAALITELHTKISSTSSLKEILIFSKCLEILKLGNISIVSTYSDLLSIDAKKAEVYFVDDEDNLYYNFGSVWVSIFDVLSTVRSYSWGSNTYGSLGDDSLTNRSSPVSVVGGFGDWVQMSAGYAHNLGVRANRTAWAWGLNTDGRLGDGTSTYYRTSPVSVVGGFSDWVQVSAGGVHSLGLRANGSAWAWGNNTSGRLGDGTVTSRSSPVSVVGGFDDWVQVSAGDAHSLAVRANGSLWSWGNNNQGRLGDGAVVARSSPVSVVGGFNDWVQVSAGGYHSLGVRANGTAWAWGFNGSGRLGDNTATTKTSPVSVVGGFSDWVQVSAGNAHSLAIRANGSAWAWGSNTNGRLGDDTATTRSSPVLVVGGFTDWVQVSAGELHSLGLRSNGTAWAWGNNTNGRLGDDTVTLRSSPVSVVGGFDDWVQVSAGGVHSLAIKFNESV
jgi:alpha-tubulin suppressor-like RCC1 family protein